MSFRIMNEALHRAQADLHAAAVASDAAWTDLVAVSTGRALVAYEAAQERLRAAVTAYARARREAGL